MPFPTALFVSAISLFADGEAAVPTDGLMAILVAIGAGGGAILKSVIDALIVRWKARGEHVDKIEAKDTDAARDVSIRDSDSLRGAYSAIVDQLQDELSRLRRETRTAYAESQKQILALMQQHTECQKENAALHERVRSLEQQVSALRNEVDGHHKRLDS